MLVWGQFSVTHISTHIWAQAKSRNIFIIIPSVDSDTQSFLILERIPFLNQSIEFYSSHSWKYLINKNIQLWMFSLTLSNWLNLLIQLLINHNEFTRYSSHKNENNSVFCILFDMISNPMIGHIETYRIMPYYL